MDRDKNGILMCLCPVCRDQFAGIPGVYLKREDKAQHTKETCTYCTVRNGYDYRIFRREVKQKNNE